MTKKPNLEDDANFADFLRRNEEACAISVQKLRVESDALLTKLKESALLRSKSQAAAVNNLVSVAVQACAFIQALYFDENHRRAVEAVARVRDVFPALFDLSLPSALRDVPRNVEARGDQMRRGLANLRDAKARMKSTGKTDFDWLRLAMEGFLKSVYFPANYIPNADKRVTSLDGNWDVLSALIENNGAVAVHPEARQRLLLPENERNPVTWAREFVEWYKQRHPWPFKDRQGNESFPKAGEQVRDPIHQIAYEAKETAHHPARKRRRAKYSLSFP